MPSFLDLLHAAQSGRGGGIRTPTSGFGDRRSTVEPTPLYPEQPPPAGAKGLPCLTHSRFASTLRVVCAPLRASRRCTVEPTPLYPRSTYSLCPEQQL